MKRPAVFELALKLSRARFAGLDKAPPKQGHPWVYPHSLYAALLVFRAYFGLTYRDTVALFKDLYPESPSPALPEPQLKTRRPRRAVNLSGCFRVMPSHDGNSPPAPYPEAQLQAGN